MKNILKYIRKLFLLNKTFIGTYADNLIDVKRFIGNEEIIALYWHSDVLNIQVLESTGEKRPEFLDVIIDEQLRAKRREFRKTKKAILFYVDNNFFTRSLGFRKGKTHYNLSPWR